MGVDPAEPSPPIGFTSSTVMPSCSSTAWRMAAADPLTSRCAVAACEYTMGNVSSG
jgi:hypothetical protein